MTWYATKMRSTPCWSCCSPNSRRFLLIPRGPRLWRFSNAIPAHRPSPVMARRQIMQELVGLAKSSGSPGVAVAGRSSSLRILCDQLDHTQKNLEQRQREIDQLLNQDPKATDMLGVPEFGPTTVAVLRQHWGIA